MSEEIIRFISAKKDEPEFMLEWRLKAFRHWLTLEKNQAEPKWANIHYPPIDYQGISYYSAPKQKPNLKSLDELDPEILRTYEKLGHSCSLNKKRLPVSPLTPCLTAFPSPPPSRKSSTTSA